MSMKKKWYKESLLSEALKYQSRKDFRKLSSGAYDAALRLNIVNEICSHMPIERKSWTLKELQEEALKYNRKVDFQKYSRKAYFTAFGRGLLGVVCKHMAKDSKINGIPHNKKWYIETIEKEAKKYFYRSDFKAGCEGAYDAAKDMKILDKVCSHMKNSVNTSSYEQKIVDEIKKYYLIVTKIRDRRVVIPNKPWIKGFDIDIYVPSVNKGIEIDGEYWHSYDQLIKSRPSWPKEELLNYHKIKDEYFLSKNVKILHISDKDIVSEPEQSLLRILNFLRN